MESNITTIGTLAGSTFVRSDDAVYIHYNDGISAFYCTAATFGYTIAGQYFLGNTAPLESAKGAINGIVAAKDRV